MDFKSLLEETLSTLELSDDQKKKNIEKEVKVFKEVHDSLSDRPNENIEIPKFFISLPKPEDSLGIKLLEDARSRHLNKISKDLLDHNELKDLYSLLCQHQSVSDKDEGEKFIDYKNFLKAKEAVVPKCRKFFTPTTFAKLQQGDPDGRINLTAFFNYVMRKTWHYQTRDLETYILELIPTLPKLEDLEESFYNFYICTAVRKFFFFLDPLRTHRVKIQDVLACGFLDDLLELRDEGLSVDRLEKNWFSATSALRVYGQYLHLDKNHNGVLSKEELAAYGTGTLTPVFIERVFQAISKQITESEQEPINFEDVKDEIFDMAKPKDPSRITLQDLIDCGQGGTIVNLLIDVNGFWSYETREDGKHLEEN
ncbi:hypothetical protein M8J76_012984 [Diaphorina citri]|nr:hypothetical protein M8J76_012984 [Diaphorina citri]